MPGSHIPDMSIYIHRLSGGRVTLVADVYDELVFQQFLDGLEGLSPPQVADAGDQLSGHVLVVSHAHLDRSQDSQLFAGNEV